MTGAAASVLLVDDRPENLLALEAVLAPLGCRTVSVTSGEEALKRLLVEEFALVVLDVQMPGLDGFETAELIKGRERTRGLPIIFVTAISKERQHVFRGYSSGAVDYVLKPYDPAVLRSKVQVFLELDDRARAAASGQALYRATFACAPRGMARLDADFRIVEANAALASLLGRPEHELAGRLLDTLVDRADRTPDADLRIELLAGRRQTFQHEVTLLDRSGTGIPCELSFALARARGRVPDAVVVQVEDLRERRRAEAEREQLVREQAARAQAEEVSQRLATLQGITDAALESLSFDDLVGEVLDRTTRGLSVDTAAIVLDDGDGHSTVYRWAPGVEAGVHRRRERLGGGHPLGEQVAAVLDVPLVVDGAPIGALHVGTLFSRSFPEEDAAVLALAAQRIGLALTRLQLFERERRTADELQRSLLPDALPVLPGYETAVRYRAGAAGTEVGGDWYDAVVQPGGRLVVVVGDVAGRGIAAAAEMARLRAAFRAYAFEGQGPAAILTRLNALQDDLGAKEMATVAVVAVDPLSGALLCASAGHLPPLVVDAQGTSSLLEVRRGLPLGTVDDFEYVESAAELPPGALLALYSDGLVEVRGESLDEGLERLGAAARSAPEALEGVADHLLAGAPVADAEDDVTLLVLRRADPACERVRLDVPGTPLGLKVMRETARRWLEAGGASASTSADVTMALNEAVQNAFEHGHGRDPAPVEVVLARTDGDAVVEVRDRGRWRQTSSVDRGRGLGLMRALMASVEIDEGDEGTTVRMGATLGGGTR